MVYYNMSYQPKQLIKPIISDRKMCKHQTESNRKSYIYAQRKQCAQSTKRNVQTRHISIWKTKVFLTNKKAMTLSGCPHLQALKSEKGTESYKILHACFISCTSADARRRKVTIEIIRLPMTAERNFKRKLLSTKQNLYILYIS